MKVSRSATSLRRSLRLAVAPLLIVALTIPLTVHALASVILNAQGTPANNVNDPQDLVRQRAGRAATRPAIASGSDTVSGTVTDATSGNPSAAP